MKIEVRQTKSPEYLISADGNPVLCLNEGEALAALRGLVYAVGKEGVNRILEEMRVEHAQTNQRAFKLGLLL